MATRIRSYWTLRFLLGLGVLLASGFGLPAQAAAALAGGTGPFALDVAAGLLGFWVALGAVTPLVHSLAEDARLRAEWGRPAHDAFASATTAQQVFLLLLGVAEADGPAGPAERELVRRFLLRRFVDPATGPNLRTWESQTVPTRDLAGLARRVARGLDLAERATLFSWSCLVAMADGSTVTAEHEALRQVARGLGLADGHARLLFLLAQQAQQRGEGARREDGARAGEDRGRKAAAGGRPWTERDRALQTLDLPADASPELIRRRHRQLVRRFHPDAQPNLGPVAQQEATERFRAIQRAYEVLTAR